MPRHMPPGRSRVWGRIPGQILSESGPGSGPKRLRHAPAGRSGPAAPLSRPPACLPISLPPCLPSCVPPRLLFCLAPAAFCGCGRVLPKATESSKPVWTSASSSVSPRALPCLAVLAGRYGDVPASRVEVGIHWTGRGRCGTDRTEMGQLCTAGPSCAVPLSQGTAARASPRRGGEKPHQHWLTIASCLLAGSSSLFVTPRHGQGALCLHRALPGLGSCTARCIRKDGQGCWCNKGGLLSQTLSVGQETSGSSSNGLCKDL